MPVSYEEVEGNRRGLL